MAISAIFIIIPIIALAAYSLFCGINAKQLKTGSRIMGTLSTLPFLFFSSFGYLASFELNTVDALPWKLGYSIMVLISLLLIIRICFAKEKVQLSKIG